MQNIEAENYIHVTVAVILNKTGQVLISKRGADVHQANCWEYPGGKVHSRESAFDALVREINEELGLEITQATPIMRVPHNYPDNKKVLLDVWRVDSFNGSPSGREGQQVQWCDIYNLENLSFPEANEAITDMMMLPSIYGITPSNKIDTSKFIPKLDTALENGLKLLQIRQPEMSKSELTIFTEQVLERCKKFNARVMVNSDREFAIKTGAHGAHLNSSILMNLPDKKLSKKLIISASCHNKEELHKAGVVGADFVVLSPVLPTKSHPNAITLGWEKFKQLATECNMPVYALGGMGKDTEKEAKLAGAVGIAMLSGLWD